MAERAVLITVQFENLPRDGFRLEDAAKELEELSRSAGLFAAKSLTFKQKKPNAPLLIGRGKAVEIRDFVKHEKADTVVFDNDLSGTQQRNLEEIVGMKTIDRTQLILDIFAQRAKSTEGKLQVELAQLKYLLPRLSGKGIYLSRLGGGIGTRGPGEQKLEVDRRRIRERIARLSRELDGLHRRRKSGLEKKKEKEFPIVALVGYTNAGKSTLFNRLTQSNVPVEDKLFSTLDTTTRLLELPGNQKVLLVDTVGFVSRLPHHLVESFKATLEEVTHADILLHVADASRPDFELVQKSVNEVLKELGVGAHRGAPLLVFNKIDLGRPASSMRGLGVSALTGEGIGRLLETLSKNLPGVRASKQIFIPKERLGLAGFLYEEGEVLERRDEPQGSYFRVNLSTKAERVFARKMSGG